MFVIFLVNYPNPNQYYKCNCAFVRWTYFHVLNIVPYGSLAYYCDIPHTVALLKKKYFMSMHYLVPLKTMALKALF